jgi:hypothetical protein
MEETQIKPSAFALSANDHDDIMSDYCAGTYCDNLSQAIRIADIMSDYCAGTYCDNLSQAIRIAG